jgi:hypothetical protein
MYFVVFVERYEYILFVNLTVLCCIRWTLWIELIYNVNLTVLCCIRWTLWIELIYNVNLTVLCCIRWTLWIELIYNVNLTVFCCIRWTLWIELICKSYCIVFTLQFYHYTTEAVINILNPTSRRFKHYKFRGLYIIYVYSPMHRTNLMYMCWISNTNFGNVSILSDIQRLFQL